MNKLTWWLIIIGAINWGLVGLSYFLQINLNVVNLIVGSIPVLEAIVYLLVGVSGILLLVPKKKETSAV